jgi:hypothetical protein
MMRYSVGHGTRTIAWCYYDLGLEDYAQNNCEESTVADGLSFAHPRLRISRTATSSI